MPRSRHEEYRNLRSIPFDLRRNIRRTSIHSANPANWHENLEIQFYLKGEGYVILDGKRYEIKEGDIVVANSNSLHFTCSENEIVFSVIIIDYQFCKDIDIDYTTLCFQPIINSSKMFDIYNEISKISDDKDNICRIAILRKLITEMLIELRSKYTDSEISKVSEKASFKLVKDAINYINNNYNHHFTLDDVASYLFVDKYNLARRFKEHTGDTIVKYTNSVRCAKAKRLISEGSTVHEAAHLCGFNNMSFFTKTFKEYIGKNPSAFKPD